MWRRADVAAALLAVLLAGPGPASGYDAPSLGDEFVKGVFSPNFVPPAAGSYELPAVKRVAGFVLRDSTGRSGSTGRITAGEGGGGVGVCNPPPRPRLGPPPHARLPP